MQDHDIQILPPISSTEKPFLCFQALRPPLFALHAFNVETALVPDQASQVALAQLRFQWWREAINSLSKETPVRHPVIQALTQVCSLSPFLGMKLRLKVQLSLIIEFTCVYLINWKEKHKILQIEKCVEQFEMNFSAKHAMLSCF